MNKFISKFLLAFTFSLTLTTMANAQTVICPPKPGSDELTFSRIMMNFGRMTMKADSLTREMSQSGSSKETPDAAVADLAVATACAQIAIEAAAAAVTEHTAGQDLSPEVTILLPYSLDKCVGDIKTKFLTQYGQMMTDFKALLELYSQQITALNYTEAFATGRKASNFADEAHAKLNTSLFCEKTLQ